MLWFNKGNFLLERSIKKISIHLMLWFNGMTINQYTHMGIEFQYILCCGSTEFERANASVYIKFQYILCCGSTYFILCYYYAVIMISIHLMLWFNWYFLYIYILNWEFQYILCCGSTKYITIPQSP
mgnify:CR=1 FL=1